MADPPLVQRIELQGAEDAQRLLRQIGETGERAFERLSRAADSADLTRLDADKARQGIEGLGRNIDQLIDRLQRMRDDVRRSGDALSSVTRSAQEIPPALRLVSSASRDASRTTTDGFNEATEAVRGTQQAAEGAAQGLQQTAQTANDAAVRIGLIAGAVAAVTAKVIELGAQGVRALLNLPTAAQDAAAKIAGQAEKLGTATSSYLRLAEAARQAGVSEEALASGTADLRKVLDSIGQAGDRVAQKIETVGGGFTIIQRGSAKVEIADRRLHNLATALAGVGLNFAQVSNAGTRMEDVLGIIAGKLAVLDEVSARTKLQALGKALGKDAATVIPVIQNLVEAQRRYNSIVTTSAESTEGWLDSLDKAAERGKAINQITKGFGTGGIVDRVAEAKKAVDELGVATAGLANRIGALFVRGPSIRIEWATKLANAVTALLFHFETLAEAQKKIFLERLGDSPAQLAFKTLVKTSEILASLWNDVLVPAGKKLFEIFDNIAKSMGGGARGSDVAGFFLAATIAVTGLVAALKLLQVAFSPVAALSSTLIALAPLLAIVGAAAFLFWDEIKAGAQAAAGQLSEFQKAFRLLLRGDFSGAWKTFKDAAFAAIDAIWKKLSEAPGVLGDLVRALGDAFRGLQTEEGKKALSEFVKTVVDLVTSIPPLVIQIAGIVAVMHRLRLIKPAAIFLAFGDTIRNLALTIAGLFTTLVSLVVILEKFGVTLRGAIGFFARLVPIIALIRAAADPLIQLIIDLALAIRKISSGDVLGGFRDAWMAVGRFVEGVIGNLILQIDGLLSVLGTLGELALGALFRLLGIDVDKAKTAFVGLNAAIRELTGFDLFRQVTDAGKAFKQFVDDVKNLGLAQAIVNEFSKLKIEIPEDSLLGLIIRGFNSERFQSSLNAVRTAITEFIEAMKKDPLIATDWIPGIGPALRAIESLITKINELLEKRRQLNEQKATPPILDVQPQSLQDSGEESARVWKTAFNAEVSESEITLSDPETATFGKAGDLAAGQYIDAFRKKMEGDALIATTDLDKLFEVFDRTPASFQQQVREIVDLGQALRSAGQSGLAETLVRHLVHVADTLTKVEGSSAQFNSAMEAAQQAWQNFIDLLTIREEDPEEGLARIKSGVEALAQSLGVAGAKLTQLAGVAPTPDTAASGAQAAASFDQSFTPAFLQRMQTAVNSMIELLTSAFANLASIVQPGVDGIVSAFITGFDQIIAKIDEAIVKLQQLIALRQSQGGDGGSPAPGFSSGGHFRGRPGRDTNLAWLTDNEFVMRVSAVKKYGLAFMHAINSGRFASGGQVKDGLPAFQQGGWAHTTQFDFSNGAQMAQALDQATNSIVGTLHQLARTLVQLGFQAGQEFAKKEQEEKKRGFFSGGLVGGDSRRGGVLDSLRGFDTGGFVTGLASEIMGVGAPRMALGGMTSTGAAPATRPLTLVIDNQRFPNLTGPSETVDALEKFAVRKRHVSIGPSPSWRT